MSFDLGTAVGYLMLDTSKFESGFKSAISDLKVFEDESSTTMDKVSALGNSFTSVGTSLTKSVTLPLVGIGAACMAVGNKFESQMSRVQAISGATGTELEKLSDQALDLGASTAFSATEVAQGMENLASAGFTTNEIMDAMPGMLDLAASSGADLATASEIAASALRGFGLEADQAGHVADVFAEAAARTNAQTEDMGQAMKYIAPVAKAMGQSLEETAAAVGILSDAGIKGSQAGTSLRGALSRLAKPTEAMQIKMKELGLSFYDAQGNMLPLNGIVAELETKLAGLTQEQRNNALVTLFGQESLSGMLALMERGSGELSALTQSFKEVDGAAADMAETMMDNTSGSIEEMMGALETLAIKIQQVLAPAVTAIAKGLTGFFEGLSKLPAPILAVIVGIAAFAAALGPLILMVGNTLTAIVKIHKALIELPAVITTVKTAFSGLMTMIKGLPALLGNLGSLFSGGSFAGIATTIAGLGAKIKAGLAAAGAAFAAFKTAAAGALAAVAPYAAAAIAAIAAVIAIVVLLVKNWDTVKATAEQVWTAMKEAVANFADAVVGFFTETIPQAFEDFKTKMQELGEKISSFFTETIPQAFESFGAKLQELGEKIGQFFTETIPSKMEELSQVFSELPGKINDAITQIIEELGYNLGYALGTVANWLVELWNTVSTEVPRIVEGIVTFFSELPDKLWTWLTETVAKVGEWATEMYNKASEACTQFLNAVTTFFSELPGRVKQWLDTTIANVQQWATEMYTKAVETCTQFLNSVNEFFSQLPGQVQAWLTDTINRVSQWVNDMYNKAVEAGSQFLNNVYNYLSQLPGRVQDILSQIIAKVRQWVTDMGQKATQAANDFYNNLVNGVSRAISAMHSIGANIVRGLANGITSMAGWLMNHIRNFANSVISGFKSAFQINSPAKVMKPIGAALPEGLEVGMEEEEGNLLKHIGSFKDAVVTRFGGISDSIQGLFSGDLFQLKGNSETDKLTSYNSVLLNTVDIYRQLKEEIQACATYAQALITSGGTMYSNLIGGQLRPALAAVSATDAHFVSVKPNKPDPADAPTDPKSNPNGDSGKPDQLVIPISIGEEQIETVVVDLLRREVRT